VATGHVEWRGKYWRMIADFGRDETGKQIRKTRTTKLTKRRDAEKMLREWLVEIEKEGLADSGKQTVGDFLRKWHSDYCRSNLAATTAKNYWYIINSHLVPSLGAVHLEKLTPMVLQEYYSKKLATGLSASSVRYHYSILREALSHAVKWRLLNRNPADATEPPKRIKPQITFLTPENIPALIEAIAGHKYAALFLTALYTGMRRSELVGMLWKDVDLERGYIILQRSRHLVPGEGYIMKETKSKKSRLIAIPPPLQIILSNSTRVNEFVFTQPDGNPVTPDTASRSFTKLAKAAGFHGLTLHGARHTCATFLLAQGVPDKAVQEQLGHSSIAVTKDIYAHVTPSLQEHIRSVWTTFERRNSDDPKKDSKKPGV
jgi:integrase